MAEAAKSSKKREDRLQLLEAMAAFRGADAVRANMRLVASGALDIREAISLVRRAVEDEGPQTRELTYQSVKAGYDQLASQLPREVLPYMALTAGGFCDASHRADAEAFFKDRSGKQPGGERMLSQVLERIDLCIAEKERQAPSVASFLKGYGRPPSPAKGPSTR
jgi:alanyl aminopeptidase